MAFRLTKEYRELHEEADQLAKSYWGPDRHFALLIEQYLSKRLQLEDMRMESAQLQLKIDDAKEYLTLLI